MEHPVSRDSLVRFAAGSSTREEGRTIALHLLKGCVTCAATLRYLQRQRAPTDAYDRSLDRFERGLRAEVEAPRLEEMLARR